MRALASWLRQVREEAGLSQTKLESIALRAWPDSGVRQARLTDWENAKSAPTFRQLEVLCRALELDDDARSRGFELWRAVQIADIHDPPSADKASVS